AVVSWIRKARSLLTWISDRFVLCVAERFQVAFQALRLARLANPPPVPNDLVRKEDPFVLGNHLHQVLFDLLRILVSRQVQALGDSLDMGVHDYAARDPIRDRKSTRLNSSHRTISYAVFCLKKKKKKKNKTTADK